MASMNDKMQRAKELIKEKRYDEARAILRTVDHEKAYEWLDRLDKIAPKRATQDVTAVAQKPTNKSRKPRIKSKTVTVSSKALFGKTQLDNALEKYGNEGWRLVEQSPAAEKNKQVLRFEYEMSDEEAAAEDRGKRNRAIAGVVVVFVCGILFCVMPAQGQRIQSVTQTAEMIVEDTRVAVNVVTAIAQSTKDADATATATHWTPSPTFTVSPTATITSTATVTSTPLPSDTPIPSATPTVEIGTRTNPYPVGQAGSIRDGRLQTNGLKRAASADVARMNMFNVTPVPGQEWVIANVTFFCELESDETCVVTVMQFDIVGDLGQAYDNELFAVIDNAFTGEVFGGGQITGNIGFIINSTDSNLLFAVDDMRGRTFFALPN